MEQMDAARRRVEMSNEIKRSLWWRKGWWRWRYGIREILIVAIIYGGYRFASYSLPHKQLVAFENSYDIVNLERHLHIFVERNFQSFILSHTVVIQLINFLYTFLYYPALFSFGFWAYFRHRRHYVMVRNVLLVSAGVAFTVFALYPVAPPRMLPELGFVDTMARFGTLSYGSSGVRNLANPFAAMPSLHFAWTLLIGIAIVHIAKNWWLRIIGILVPLGMLTAIVGSSNHFFLDAFGGGLTIGIAYILVRLFGLFWEKARAMAARSASPGEGRPGRSGTRVL